MKNAILVALSLTATTASSLDIFTMKHKPKLLEHLTESAIKTHNTSFVAKEPNFATRPPAKYTGVSVSAIARKFNLPKDAVVTFLSKDEYVYADTLQALINTEALVANQIEDKPIPERFGGPITLIHKEEVAMDRYIWYLETMILGDVIQPELTLVSDKGDSKNLSWKSWSRHKDKRTKELVFPSPRGYRLNGIDSSTVKSTIAYLPLSSIINDKNIGSLTISSFSRVHPSLELSPSNFSSLSIAFARNGKEIPAYEGGPFILFKEGDAKNMNSKFHVTKIVTSPKGK